MQPAGWVSGRQAAGRQYVLARASRARQVKGLANSDGTRYLYTYRYKAGHASAVPQGYSPEYCSHAPTVYPRHTRLGAVPRIVQHFSSVYSSYSAYLFHASPRCASGRPHMTLSRDLSQHERSQLPTAQRAISLSADAPQILSVSKDAPVILAGGRGGCRFTEGSAMDGRTLNVGQHRTEKTNSRFFRPAGSRSKA
jgi:hypothetical protein